MKTTIFVVDDERSIADTLVTILNTQGYLAVAFYDAKSALAKCSHLQPEIVLSDVVMPGMNGVDMAVEIEQRYPACRVILFSGQVGTVDLLAGARRRGYDFRLLAKPLHPMELLRELKQKVAA